MSDVEKGAATANASQATVAQAEVYPVVPAPRTSRIADPTPLGLFSFASTLLVLSFYNAHTRHVSTPNVVVGMALFYGGLAQLLAGMWSFAIGSQLGATAFSTYGGFWMSYAALQIPNSGIVAAYEADPTMLSQAIGIMLIVFMILSFFFAIASLRVNIMFVIVFAHIVMVFACLAASQFTSSTGLQKAGGWFGIIASFLSFYCGVALMLAPLGVMDLPLGSTARKSV